MNTLEYEKFLNSINSYSTLQEKNAVLLNFSEDNTAKDYYNKLELSYDASNDLERIALIFKSREKSVDENINITMTCVHCNFMSIYNVPIHSLFFKEPLDESIPIKLMENIEDIEKEFGNINDLSIDEFNKIETIIMQNNKKIFNPNIVINCNKCLLENKMIINYKDIISKYPIKNIYEQYLDLTQFTHMTKSDVDNLPPFEREIFMNLIQDRENKKE